MATDRFFRWLMGGIVLLAVAALGVALYRQRRAHYRSDNTPQAVAYNYLLAIRREDWDKAYDLLGNAPCKPERHNFEMAFQHRQFFPDVELGQVRQQGEKAWVSLRFYYDEGLFGNLMDARDVMPMVLRREAGRWKIVEIPPPLWPFPPLEMKSCPEHSPYGGD